MRTVKNLKNLLKKSPFLGDLLGLLALSVEGGELNASGWRRSFRAQRPIARNGDPIPWLTYGAIRFLEERAKPGMKIFEFGSGNSTLWWASRVELVVSCEHDLKWFEELSTKIPSNVSLLHVPLGPRYPTAIERRDEVYDLVIVDGRQRLDCCRHSLGSLGASGVLVWDNSDRKDYTKALEFLRPNGFRSLDFEGLGPINRSRWRTSIVYRSSNCLGI